MRLMLLQARDVDDPMKEHEIRAFSRTIGCPAERIAVLDVLTEEITERRLQQTDVVLIGGSGHYSACGTEDWLVRTLEGLKLIHSRRQPMFASCWGFQALARALGGRVTNDRQRAEVGTHPVKLTAEGRRDPLFGDLSDPFLAQMGHEDHVVQLPPGAVRLACGDKSENQAYTFEDRPIYATQFHAELNGGDLRDRIRNYPEYLRLLTGLTFDQFARQTQDTPQCEQLVPRFLDMITLKG